MRILFSFVLFTLVSFSLFSQEKLEKPTWPHHGYEPQMKAIPFYNEACELYANGDKQGALKSLLEAVNTSFALTEAQLFLASIYEELGEHKKALVYYNSGVDFEIRQKSHYYFHLFNLGMRFGEYDMIKHNMKHFKKLFGTKPTIQYEKGHPFGIQDWEYIRESIALIYNFRNWQSEFRELDIDFKKEINHLAMYQNKLLVNENGLGLKKWHSKKQTFVGKKSVKLPEGEVNNPVFSRDGQIVVFERSSNKNVDLYYALKSGNKWSEAIRFEGTINSDFYDGQVYINNAKNCIYFSSTRNGNSNLYLAKVDFETQKFGKAEVLERVNSFRDEMYPRFNEDESIFYFSSNGHPGFGGYDLFWTQDKNKENGVIYPMNPRNMKAGINSKDDELLGLIFENKFILKRIEIEGDKRMVVFKRIEPVKRVEFELDMKLVEEIE